MVMYILFDKIYEFETVISDFELKKIHGKSSIECLISFYTKNNEHRTILVVMNEIENKGIELEQWAAKSLPIIFYFVSINNLSLTLYKK